jgi:hypothetical protein
LEDQNNVKANQWNKTKTHTNEVPLRKLCFVVSQGRKDTLGKIQKKMVWFILGIIFLPNNNIHVFMLTILNQT